jgi:dTDP-4-amino-4,6-dideoxygalactose transaminase
MKCNQQYQIRKRRTQKRKSKGAKYPNYLKRQKTPTNFSAHTFVCSRFPLRIPTELPEKKEREPTISQIMKRTIVPSSYHTPPPQNTFIILHCLNVLLPVSDDISHSQLMLLMASALTITMLSRCFGNVELDPGLTDKNNGTPAAEDAVCFIRFRLSAASDVNGS